MVLIAALPLCMWGVWLHAVLHCIDQHVVCFFVLVYPALDTAYPALAASSRVLVAIVALQPAAAAV